MENFKVKVNSEAESKEAQELFFELGFAWLNTEKTYRDIGENPYISSFKYSNRMELGMGSGAVDNKELTIPELRDMVVFKRNDVVDATHRDSNNYDWYVASDEKHYRMQGDIWVHQPYVDCIDLKPIEKEMTETEYLMQGKNGEHLMESVGQLNSGKIVSAFVVDGEEKHSHYKKDVSHLNFIDPYRIAQLYDLHPCADHIAKKALCTGKRGHKDLMRDIQDIIDTAERWKQMIQEDQNAI